MWVMELLVVGRGRQVQDARLVFYTSRFVGQVAQNLVVAALFVIVSTGGHAAMGLTSLLVASLIPAIAFGLAGGALADRLGPMRGMLAGTFLRVALVLGAFTAVGSPHAALVVAFLAATIAQLFNPAEMALVHTIERQHAGRAHSLLIVLQYAGQGVGMLVLAPALYFIAGPAAILAGALVAYVALCGLLFFLSLRISAAAIGAVAVRHAFSFRTTCRFFLDQPGARYAVVVMALKTTVSRGIVVALPIYLAQDLDLSKGFLPLVLLPGVAGAVIGLIWCARTVDVERARDVMRLSVVAMIVGVFALAVLDYGVEAVAHFSGVAPIAHLEASMNTTFIIALPASFVLGLAFSGALISARVTLTGTAPVGQQARIFATQGTLTEALLVLPLLLTGVGTEVVGARATLAAIGIVAVLAGLILELPRFRAFPLVHVAEAIPEPALGTVDS